MADSKDQSGEFIEKLSQKWTRLAKASKTIAAPRTGNESDKAFYVRIFKLNKLPIPKFLLEKSDDARNFQVHAHLSATLFDFDRKAFFGNTWVGNREDLKGAVRGGPVSWNGMEAVACNVEFSSGSGFYGFVFHSTQNLSDIRLVYEVVITVLDSKGEVRIEEYSICWCVAEFSPKGEVEKLSNWKNQAEKSTNHSLMTGTPRLLIFTGADKNALGKAKIEGATLNHVSLTHSRLTQLLQTVQCMAENELCGGSDPVLAAIPGIQGWETSQPKPEPQCALEIQGASVRLSSQLPDKLRAYVRKATGAELSLRGVALAIGVHNGRRFLADPTKVATTEGARGEYRGAAKVLLKEYVPSALVAVVVMVLAEVEAAGSEMDVCLGWVPLVPLEVERGAAQLLVGSYAVALRTTPPMLSVSSALVFSDAEGRTGKAALDAAPRLTLQVAKDPKGGGTAASVPTKPLAERMRILQGIVAVDDAEEEAGAGAGAGVGAGLVRGSKKAELTPVKEEKAVVEAATEEMEEGGTGSEKQEAAVLDAYTLVCDVAEIGRGKGKVEIAEISMDEEADQVFDRLEERFGIEVMFEYSPADGEPVMVDNDETFDAFVDWIEDAYADAGDDCPKVPITIWPYDEESVREEGKHPAAAAGAETTGDVGKAAVTKTDKPKPLEILTLVCRYNRNPAVRVEGVSVTAPWDDVAQRVRAEVGVEGAVVLEWVNAEEEDCKVRTSVDWKLLVDDVMDDWEGPREIDGEVDVDIIAEPPKKPSPRPAPTTTGDKAEGKAAAAAASPGGERAGSRRASPSAKTGSRQASPSTRPDSRKSSPKPVAQRQPSPSPKPPSPAAPKQPPGHDESAPSGKPPTPPVKKHTDVSPNRPPALEQPEDEGEDEYTEEEEDYTEEADVDDDDGEVVAEEDAEEEEEGAVSESEVALEEAAAEVVPPRPIVLAEETQDLSRGTRAKLLTKSQSQLVQRSTREVRSASARPRIVDMKLEESDTQRGHHILFHILAIRAAPTTARVFLSMRFYNFSTVRTPALRIVRTEGASADAAADLVVDGLPTRATSDEAKVEAGVDGKGVVVRFLVSPMEARSPSMADDALFFARFLDNTAMEVAVWDADSLLPVGASFVALRPLLRQGRASVQCSGDFPLFDALAPHLVQAASSTLRDDVPLSPTALPNTPFAPPVEEKGVLTLRMVNVAVKYPDDPETGRPRTDKGDSAAHGLIAAGDAGATRPGDVEWKGMALVYANRSEIARELKRSNLGPEALTSQSLLRAMFACSLPLTVRQANTLVKHLVEQFGGEGRINIRELHSGSERVIRASGEDEDTKEMLAHHVVVLTGILASRYGGLSRAFEWISEGKTISYKLFVEMMARVRELHKHVTVSDAECDKLFELMEPEPTGVTRDKFDDFFGIVVGDGRPGYKVRKAEVDAKNRKLARWTKLQLARQGLTDEEDLSRKQMLGVVRVMREAQKTQKITEFLHLSFTTTVRVALGFGELHYFQHTISNPFNADRVVKIRVDDREVSVVTDAREWRELHRLYGEGPDEAEDDLVHKSPDDRTLFHLHLPRGRSVRVPFKVRSLRLEEHADSTAPTAGAAEPRGWTIEGRAEVPEGRTVLVSFSFQKGLQGAEEPLGALNVSLAYRASIVDRTFHFYHGHHQDFRKRIMVDGDDPWAGWRLDRRPGQHRSPVTFVDTEDSGVVIKHLPTKSEFQQFEVSCSCGEAGHPHVFHLLLYKDATLSSLWAVYRVVIHPLLHSIVKAVTGSVDRRGFVSARSLEPEGGQLPVAAFSSNPALLDVDSPEADLALSSQLQGVPLVCRPLDQGRADVLVHFVAREHLARVAQQGTAAAHVTCACLVTAIAKKPFLGARYTIKMNSPHCSKKISYENRSEQDKVFRLRTNRPDILEFRHKGLLPIPANKRGYMKLKFCRPPESGRAEVCLYINTEDDQNEECLRILVE